jgi:hypothetical protein
MISPQRLNQFLDYPGSSLAPVIKTPIEYYQADRRVQYEDLFYSHLQPVGLRQYHTLDLTPGSSGIIRIGNIGKTPEEGYAAANAAIRAYVDVFLTRAILLYIAVPIDSFDNLIDGIQRCGFYLPDTSSNQPGVVVTTLTVMSEPPGRSQTLFFSQPTK